MPFGRNTNGLCFKKRKERRPKINRKFCDFFFFFVQWDFKLGAPIKSHVEGPYKEILFLPLSIYWIVTMQSIRVLTLL